MTRLSSLGTVLVVALVLAVSSTLSAQGSVTNLGPGCGLATDPVLNSSLAVVGAPITLDLMAGPPAAPGLLLASASPASTLPFFGCTLYVALEHNVAIPISTDSLGDWSTTFGALPPAASGQEFALQALFLSGGLALSNGLKVTVGNPAARVRVFHASPDAPDVNVLVNGAQALSGVTFKQASPLVPIGAGTYSIQVDGILPSGSAPVIGPVNLTFGAITDTTILAVDSVANIAPLVITNPTASVPVDSTRVQVVHASPSAPTVDVYVTAPGIPLAGQTPLGSFSFTQDLGPVVVPADDYQIRVTPVNMPGTVVFDSGTVTLPPEADLMIAAVDNTTTGASPISLVVLDGTASFEIFDAAAPANIRVVHASPNAPPVDVVVNDNFASPLISNLSFPMVTPFTGVAPGSYNIKVAATGTMSTVINANLTFAQATETTILAVDNLATIQPLVLADDRRSIATQAKLRVVHASPTAGLVDIYLTAPGAGLSGQTPVLASVPFLAFTGYLPVAQGMYDLTITPAGTTNPAIGPALITLNNGGVYTAVARDATGGGTPLGTISLDDTF